MSDPNRRTVSDSIWHRRALVWLQAFWFITIVVTSGLYALSIPAQARELQMFCTGNCEYGQLTAAQLPDLVHLGWSLNFYVGYNIALNTVFYLVFLLVGAVIFWRKSDNWFGIYVAFTLVLFGISFSSPLPLLAKYYPAFNLPLLTISATGGTLIGIFFYLFPDGQFMPRWTPWLIILVAVREFAYNLAPESPLLYLFPVELGTFIFAQVYRYSRRSNAIERQQTKWFVYGASLGILGFGSLIVFVSILTENGQPMPVLVNIIGSILLYFSVLLIPLSIMMAILRSHLWDIDIIIRRTLIYSALTAMLVLVYFGSIAVLQQLFRALTGQTSNIAIILSTLGIATLFNPLRHRVQRIIDRRFYRRKYDAQKVLARFGATARDEVDLQRLTEGLLIATEETMQPTSVSLSLKEVKTERSVKQA